MPPSARADLAGEVSQTTDYGVRSGSVQDVGSARCAWRPLPIAGARPRKATAPNNGERCSAESVLGALYGNHAFTLTGALLAGVAVVPFLKTGPFSDAHFLTLEEMPLAAPLFVGMALCYLRVFHCITRMYKAFGRVRVQLRKVACSDRFANLDKVQPPFNCSVIDMLTLGRSHAGLTLLDEATKTAVEMQALVTPLRWPMVSTIASSVFFWLFIHEYPFHPGRNEIPIFAELPAAEQQRIEEYLDQRVSPGAIVATINHGKESFDCVDMLSQKGVEEEEKRTGVLLKSLPTAPASLPVEVVEKLRSVRPQGVSRG